MYPYIQVALFILIIFPFYQILKIKTTTSPLQYLQHFLL